MDHDELADIREAALETMTDTLDIYANVATDDGRGGSISSSQKIQSAVPCRYQSKLGATDLQLVADRPANLLHAIVIIPPQMELSNDDTFHLHCEFFDGTCTIMNVQVNTDGATQHVLIEHENPV